ncbi:MAG: nickel pincer cofactor biosynthesis protein LarC [Janthinobacterium lividum]
MKIAYFDCFSGVSGDMTLGALLACGADEAEFRRQLAGLKVPGYELVIQRVTREGITATDVDVKLMEQDRGHGRHLLDIASLLDASTLSAGVRQNALAIFTRLADVEAKIHGTTREEIHFHEVGAVDAIVDIVGSCLLLEMLGVERVVPSSLPCGYGTIKCMHGIMPVPAPATLELLSGFPVHSVDIRGELVTPTGAALLTTLGDPATAGKMPSMRILSSGFGAGKKQFVPDMPNLLRVIIGETAEEVTDKTPQMISVLETNLDDQNPESFDLLMERAFGAGALDVFFTPIQMKKNRPATLVTVLCPTDKVDTLASVLFRETGTFGVRIREQSRLTLARSWRTVSTQYGDIRLKVGTWQGGEITASPEYEDCKRAAVEHNVPLSRVYDAVRQHR